MVGNSLKKDWLSSANAAVAAVERVATSNAVAMRFMMFPFS
jgi:hypothetical protein